MNMSDLIRREQALTAIKTHSDFEPEIFDFMHKHERAIGSVFDWADFYTGEVTCKSERLDYFVLEPSSRLVLTFAHATRAEALAEARETLLDAGEVAIADLIVSRRIAIAANDAEKLIQSAAKSQEAREPSNLNGKR